MKEIFFRISVVFAAALTLIMSIATASVNVSAAEKSWQEAYLEVIDDSQDDSSAYLLCYIDNDEVPELYMWDNSKHLYTLYTYYDGKSILCDNWADRESMWIYNNKNGCFWSTRKSNATRPYIILQKLENGSCSEPYQFCIDRSETDVEKYLINDEDVGQEEYERKMSELEADYPLSNDFQVNGKLPQTYDEIRQYLQGLIESENTQETENIQEIETQAATEKTTNATTAAAGSQRVPSPKTGDTEPIFCELILVGFIAVGTAMLLRKKYKSNSEK